MGKKDANRHMLRDLAQRTKEPKSLAELAAGGGIVPNREELRRRGINMTRRTGKGIARIKKARAKHKEA